LVESGRGGGHDGFTCLVAIGVVTVIIGAESLTFTSDRWSASALEAERSHFAAADDARAGVSSVPQVAADAPKVVWAIDFQFDSTIDGKAIKIASMIGEHTRASLLHLVERSITAERLVAELEDVFAAAGGPPRVLRMDNGPELVSQALQQFCAGRVGLSYIPPDNRGTTVTSSHSITGS
jgi:transposase InsO family protein